MSTRPMSSFTSTRAISSLRSTRLRTSPMSTRRMSSSTSSRPSMSLMSTRLSSSFRSIRERSALRSMRSSTALRSTISTASCTTTRVSSSSDTIASCAASARLSIAGSTKRRIGRADELHDRGAGGDDALGRTDVGRPDHELHHRAREPARGTNGVRRVGHRGRLDLGRDFRRDRHERRPLFGGLHAHTIGRVAAFPPFREVRCVQFATAASVVHDIARPGRRGNPCKRWSSSKCAAAASSRSSA